MKFVFAQISDTHFGGSGQAEERARRTMDHLRGLPLDALLVTGDIADHATVSEYETAREVLAMDVPTIYCPGNHDDRRTMRKVLFNEDGDEPINQALHLDGLTIALADSTVPGEDHGHLEEPVLAWLDSVLTPDVPALVGMHHPAADLGLPLVDAIKLRNPSALDAVVERHPQIVALLAGHAHTAAATTFAGVPLLVGPATISTSVMPFEGSSHPWSLVFDLPPAVALHVWDDGRLSTHIRVC